MKQWQVVPGRATTADGSVAGFGGAHGLGGAKTFLPEGARRTVHKKDGCAVCVCVCCVCARATERG